MVEKPFKSWDEKHPHMRKRINYALIFLAGVALFLLVFYTLGPDTLRTWVEGGAASQGIDLTNQGDPK